MDVTIKNVPESVYRVIRREARQQGRSINSQIIRTLEAEAAMATRSRRLRKLRREMDSFAASLPPLGDSTPLIRLDRRR